VKRLTCHFVKKIIRKTFSCGKIFGVKLIMQTIVYFYTLIMAYV